MDSQWNAKDHFDSRLASMKGRMMSSEIEAVMSRGCDGRRAQRSVRVHGAICFVPSLVGPDGLTRGKLGLCGKVLGSGFCPEDDTQRTEKSVRVAVGAAVTAGRELEAWEKCSRDAGACIILAHMTWASVGDFDTSHSIPRWRLAVTRADPDPYVLEVAAGCGCVSVGCCLQLPASGHCLCQYQVQCSAVQCQWRQRWRGLCLLSCPPFASELSSTCPTAVNLRSTSILLFRPSPRCALNSQTVD